MKLYIQAWLPEGAVLLAGLAADAGAGRWIRVVVKALESAGSPYYRDCRVAQYAKSLKITPPWAFSHSF